MKTYTIYATYIVEVSHDIEAESQDDAWDKAYHIDGGDYKETGWNEWQIDRIEENENA